MCGKVMKMQEKVKNTDEILRRLKRNKKLFYRKFGISKIKVFGSYVRNTQTPGSDLDLIVDFKEIPGLIKLIQIEKEISNLLGVKVDLLTEEGISPYIRKYIEKEAISI